MKIITVLGNFSGRNSGDAAILGNLLDDISKNHSDVQFWVPTINVGFIYKHFNKYNIKAISLMPWTCALKIFGLPTVRAMLKANMVLITDNILFDRKFYNPFFNYLSTISLFSPLCKRLKIPIVLYNASLGPINTLKGVKALQRIIDASPLLILRDEKSKELLDELNFNYKKVFMGADCAINTAIPSEECVKAIIKKEGIFKNPRGTISFNINTYVSDWLYKGRSINRKQFLNIISTTIDNLITSLDVDILFIVTQYMDTNITNECLKYVKQKGRVNVVSNSIYTYLDITGILNKVKVHVGMRTHSLILSAAALTPMVSINAYPKNEGFMRTIKQEDWMIDFKELTVDKLSKLIMQAWFQREKRRALMMPIVQSEKNKASGSAALIGDLL